MSTSTDQNLWDLWLKKQDMEAANELVKQYSYLVSYHVERLAAHLPKSVQRDDLTSLAYLGLFDAINKFDPNRDLKFDTYASFRVRGSIIDRLRKEDWLPRSLREKAKQVEQVAEQLEQQLQREPSAAEIAEHLNTSTDEVENTIKHALFSNVLSIDQRPASSQDDDLDQVSYIIEDGSEDTPDEHILRSEMEEEVAEAIKSLNNNEQLVVSLFYHDELTMTEIGEVLNLTTSRISQIHKQALFKMKHILKDIVYL